jgi:hypothetical protein
MGKRATTDAERHRRHLKRLRDEKAALQEVVDKIDFLKELGDSITKGLQGIAIAINRIGDKF